MKTVEQSDSSHFQLEGTWTLSSGLSVHFVALKQTRDSVMDMANVYLNIEDLRPFVQGDFEEDAREGLHINIIDLVLEYPTCEAVRDLFRYFLSSTSPGATVRVPGPSHRGRLKTCPQLKHEANGCPLVSTGPHELLTDGTCKEGSEDQSQHKAESSDLNTIECTSCPLKFGNKRELLNHVKSEHRTRNRTHFKCDKCQRTFSSNKTKLAHLREAHRDSRPKTKVEPRPASLMCPTCGEKKNSEYNLSQHIKKFHENAFPEPVVCHLCTETKQLRNRKYHTPFSFELHMRQIHSGGAEGRVVCEYCCKEFIGNIGKCKFALREHIQGVHLGIRPSCDECSKTFVSNRVLNKHKKHVHRQLGSYPCKACGKVFRYSIQAIDHEYKDRGLTPYICKHCPFRSSDNWALSKHKKLCPAASHVTSQGEPLTRLQSKFE